MKKSLLFFIILIIFVDNAVAQYIADTFGIIPNIPCSGSGFSPIEADQRYMSWTKYGSTTLNSKGIVPGVTIYGVAYLKSNTGYLPSNIPASLDIKFRSGNYDSSINNNNVMIDPFHFLLKTLYLTIFHLG